MDEVDLVAYYGTSPYKTTKSTLFPQIGARSHCIAAPAGLLHFRERRDQRGDEGGDAAEQAGEEKLRAQIRQRSRQERKPESGQRQKTKDRKLKSVC